MAAAPDEFVSAYNDRDWERMRATMAPDCAYEEVGRPKRSGQGVEEVIEVFKRWASAVPEAGVEVIDGFAAEDGVVFEVEVRGSLKGPFGDFSSSGEPPTARAALIFRLGEDGSIRAVRNYYDSLVLYQVLGIEG